MPLGLKSVGKVIATRKLHVLDSPDITFEINIGEPKQFPDGHDYYCPVQILGNSKDIISYGAGIDTLQALDLALKLLASELNVLNQQFRGKLRWTDDDPTLGFTMVDGTKI